jgi:hypothetical protein
MIRLSPKAPESCTVHREIRTARLPGALFKDYQAVMDCVMTRAAKQADVTATVKKVHRMRRRTSSNPCAVQFKRDTYLSSIILPMSLKLPASSR